MTPADKTELERRIAVMRSGALPMTARWTPQELRALAREGYAELAAGTCPHDERQASHMLADVLSAHADAMEACQRTIDASRDNGFIQTKMRKLLRILSGDSR